MNNITHKIYESKAMTEQDAVTEINQLKNSIMVMECGDNFAYSNGKFETIVEYEQRIEQLQQFIKEMR